MMQPGEQRALSLLPLAVKYLADGPKSYKDTAAQVGLKKDNETVPLLHYILVRKQNAYSDADAMVIQEDFMGGRACLGKDQQAVIRLTPAGMADAQRC